MTISARGRASQIDTEKQLSEQVHVWLRLNMDMMIQHEANVEPYESEFMQVDANGVLGICYQFTFPDDKVPTETIIQSNSSE